MASFDVSHHLGDPRCAEFGATLRGVDPAQPAFPVKGREPIESRLRLGICRQRVSDVGGQLARLRTLGPDNYCD